MNLLATRQLRPIFLCLILAAAVNTADAYQSFQVSVYATARDVAQMGDTAWLEARWQQITQGLHVDKIYLESHRDQIDVDGDTLEKAKKFFADRGVKTAGGITFTIAEGSRYHTFCYSRPDQRELVRQIVEHAARHFDEIILDDFFFTNCKCESCIAGKGDKSWTQYRLELLAGVSRELVVGAAKQVNPNIKMVIKYPNWYEHFQGLGYNLEEEPRIFDGIHTGTETRDPVYTAQHLQPYQGYLIQRYLENIKPGGNGGGWVDPFSRSYIDRYAEQLWLTVFAKAPEVTLFAFARIMEPLNEADRGSWQGQGTSFDYDQMMRRAKDPAKADVALAAGYAFEQVDGFIGKLGTPIGVPSYRPYHSTGEDFLHNYLGMIGIPIDLRPEFPTEAKTILLTEDAKFDDQIVEKIKGQLTAGKSVVITSGLFRALEGRGIEDIVELDVTDRKAVSNEYMFFRGGPSVHAPEWIVLPQVMYLTNDSWEEVTAIAGHNGYPLLHSADYAKGMLYVLVVPDNFADLYKLPAEVLNWLREKIAGDMPVRLEGPSRVALFVYDNGTFIVESFEDKPVKVSMVAGEKVGSLRDLVSGDTVAGQPQAADAVTGTPARTLFPMELKPHSFRVFRAE